MSSHHPACIPAPSHSPPRLPHPTSLHGDTIYPRQPQTPDPPFPLAKDLTVRPPRPLLGAPPPRCSPGAVAVAGEGGGRSLRLAQTQGLFGAPVRAERSLAVPTLPPALPLSPHPARPPDSSALNFPSQAVSHPCGQPASDHSAARDHGAALACCRHSGIPPAPLRPACRQVALCWMNWACTPAPPLVRTHAANQDPSPGPVPDVSGPRVPEPHVVLLRTPRCSQRIAASGKAFDISTITTSYLDQQSGGLGKEHALVAPTPASLVRLRLRCKVLVPPAPPPFRALAGGAPAHFG